MQKGIELAKEAVEEDNKQNWAQVLHSVRAVMKGVGLELGAAIELRHTAEPAVAGYAFYPVAASCQPTKPARRRPSLSNGAAYMLTSSAAPPSSTLHHHSCTAARLWSCTRVPWSTSAPT